jgi:RimJ/RimL family protein N-acetyltransferase
MTIDPARAPAIGPLPRAIPLAIATPRLLLRYPCESDATPLHAYFGDEASVRYTTGRAFTEAETWRTVAGVAGHWALRGYGPYIIQQRSADSLADAQGTDGAVLGLCGLWYPGDWPEAEVKWALVPAARGRGIAREAARGVLAMLRAHRPGTPPISLIRAANARSIALARALGATFERDLPFRGEVAHVYRHAAPPPVAVRAAQPADAAAVADIHLRSRRAHVPAPIVHGDADVHRYFASVVLPQGRTWVAHAQDRLLGYVSVSTADDNGRAIGWVDHLYLDPDRVGTGIGSALMAVALRETPRPLRLYTFAANAGARRFYERQGFMPIAFGDGSGNEERTPDVLYELAA